jgi:phenol hydroxylase P3 protein
VLTNLLFVPFMSGAAYNGDMGTMTFGFSAQSDEARHMTLGLEVIKFMLEQDPDNVPIVQRWIDKWFWRGYRVLTLVGMMMDYMLPKRMMSWKEAWEIYFEQNGGALFKDLARYGIRRPSGWTRPSRTRTTSATRPGTFYNYAAARLPHLDARRRRDGLAVGEVPEHLRQVLPPAPGAHAKRQQGQALLQQDAAHAVPDLPDPDGFTEPDDPQDLPTARRLQGHKYHFCSDTASIFDTSPRSTSRPGCRCTRSTRATASGGRGPDQADFDPLAAVLRYYNLNSGATTWTSPTRRPEELRSLARAGHQQQLTRAQGDTPWPSKPSPSTFAQGHGGQFPGAAALHRLTST